MQAANGRDAVEAERDRLASASTSLRTALGRYPTRRAWLAAPEGAELATRLDAHLSLVRRFEPSDMAPTPDRDWLHAVQWNILHGRRTDRVLEALQHEPALVGADLVALEETDLGMARSGNRDVAFDLARALGLHAAWTPLFLELDAGYRASPDLAAIAPRESLFGLAFLSRFPLDDVRRVVLTSPQDLLFDRERKAGTFVALVARVLQPGAPFTMAVVHLDVHGTPRLRCEQMRQVLDAIPAGPAILAGDFNTTTFARGGGLRSARTLAVLATQRQVTLRERLLAPHRPDRAPYEPLFALLRERGYEVAPFNDATPSLDVHFDDVHELDFLPAPLRRRALAALRWVERRNAMRLDWIVARGFSAASELPPFALPAWSRGSDAASDHAPVGCGLRLRR